MIRPRLLVSALTDHRSTCREQSLLEALQGSVLSQAVTSWDVQLHIADSDPRPASEVVEGIDAVILLGGPDVHPEFYGMETGTPVKVSTGQMATAGKSNWFCSADSEDFLFLVSAGDTKSSMSLTVERSFKIWRDMKARRSWMTTVLLVIRSLSKTSLL